VRLVAATRDPQRLKPESTWYLATSLPLHEVSAEPVDEIERLRDGIEHDAKPIKHELGWADEQMRPERALVRHWQLVLPACTFHLLVGVAPSSPTGTADGGEDRGQSTRTQPAAPGPRGWPPA
jgi:hypothetical protein